jgi:hypothetical protein
MENTWTDIGHGEGISMSVSCWTKTDEAPLRAVHASFLQ